MISQEEKIEQIVSALVGIADFLRGKPTYDQVTDYFDTDYKLLEDHQLKFVIMRFARVLGSNYFSLFVRVDGLHHNLLFQSDDKGAVVNVGGIDYYRGENLCDMVRLLMMAFPQLVDIFYEGLGEVVPEESEGTSAWKPDDYYLKKATKQELDELHRVTMSMAESCVMARNVDWEKF